MSSKGKSTVASGGKAAFLPKARFPEFQTAGAWETKALAPFLRDCSGRVPSNTSLPVFSSTRDGLRRQDTYFDGRVLQNNNDYGVVPPGCFVYRHMSDDGSFKFNINDTGGDIAVSKEYPVFETVGLDSKFLLEVLNESQEFRSFALSQKAGGTRTRLYFNRLREWRIALPTLPEQQKIAECLNSADALIATQGRKVEALRAHKKSLIQQFFPQEGETQPSLRFPEFEGAGEWEEIPLSKLISALDAGVSVNSGDRPAMRQEMGVLKTSAVTNGVFNPLENKVVFDEEEIKRVREPVRADTVIISRMNTPALVGANAYVKNDYPNLFLPDRLWAAKPRPGANMRFVALVLGSDRGRAALSDLAGGSSGSMKNISKPSVLDLVVMSPSRLEQQRIADCLTSLDDLIAAETRKLDTLKAHKKGLMQQLFPAIAEFES